MGVGDMVSNSKILIWYTGIFSERYVNLDTANIHKKYIISHSVIKIIFSESTLFQFYVLHEPKFLIQ